MYFIYLPLKLTSYEETQRQLENNKEEHLKKNF